ncbi:fungal-specific transcription factor domain-containing protein, partial [Kalaharituber pfeilii]
MASSSSEHSPPATTPAASSSKSTFAGSSNVYPQSNQTHTVIAPAPVLGNVIPSLGPTPTKMTTAAIRPYLGGSIETGMPIPIPPPIGASGERERIPIAAMPIRRGSGAGEGGPVQKESMNCKSCRKKKIKCNRLRPSCGACLAFQCACVYDAIPKKRGPKTEVLEELLKRVSGLEKRLQEEKELNSKQAQEAAAAIIQARRSPPPSEEAPLPPRTSTEIDPLDTSPPLYQRAFIDFPQLKYPDTFVDVYFAHVHMKPFEILHEPTFRARLASNSIPSCQLNAVCATSARFLSCPDSHAITIPRDMALSLCTYYANASRAALDVDMPNFESFQTTLDLVSVFTFIGKGWTAYMLLGVAIRMAYGLNLHKELPHTAPVTPLEREIRRRAFWSCYLMDKFSVCGSRQLPLFVEESIRLRLPSAEPNALLPSPGPIEMGMGTPSSIFQGRLNIGTFNSGALLVDIVRILGETMRYIERGGVRGDSHFPWHPDSKLSRIQREVDAWTHRTAALYSQIPGASPGEGMYLQHPDATRLMLSKVVSHLVSCLIYRPFLPVDVGELIRQVHQHQSWQLKATKLCFVHANAIGELCEVVHRTKPSGFVWGPIMGYSIATAATIHIHGLYYTDTQPGGVYQRSGHYLMRALSHSRKLGAAWRSMKIYYQMLRWLIKSHEELVLSRNTRYNPQSKSQGVQVFHLDQFFDRYPKREQFLDTSYLSF